MEDIDSDEEIIKGWVYGFQANVCARLIKTPCVHDWAPAV
jgi:hypothetical protein